MSVVVDHVVAVTIDSAAIVVVARTVLVVAAAQRALVLSVLSGASHVIDWRN